MDMNAVRTTAAPTSAGLTTSSGDVMSFGECETGAAIDCKIMLPGTDDTNNCFVGTQVCVAGEWTEQCLDDDDAAELLGSL